MRPLARPSPCALLVACAAFAQSSADLTGRWRWSCCDGGFSGRWEITEQQADGTFHGRFAQTSATDIGSIEGRVTGDRIELVRKGTVNGQPFEQHWTGVLRGDRIEGRLEAGGFSAQRLPPEMTGSWRWSCCGGAHTGRWEITEQHPDGTFRGRFGQTSPLDIGAIEGRMQGDQVEFERKGVLDGQPFEQHWSGTLRGVILRGRLEAGDFTAEPAPPAPPAPSESPGGGICYDPQTLAFMDEWLKQAIPPQQPGESLRYESWGRVVGAARTGEISVPPRPDTRLNRCDWLWYHSPRLRSTNLGTLREYVDKRRDER